MRRATGARPTRRIPVWTLVVLVAAAASARGAPEPGGAGERVWNVARQCFQAAGGEPCGQAYDVGKRRHTGDAQPRPAPRIETGGGDADSGSGDGAEPEITILENVRRELRKLKDTEDGGKVLHSLGDLQANDAAADTNGDADDAADAGAANPDAPGGTAEPGAPTPLEKVPE